MILIRNLLPLALTALFLLQGCGSEPVNMAERILVKVEDRYRNLDRFDFQATYSTTFRQGVNSQKFVKTFRYMADRPGRLRIEIETDGGRDLLVSNGETTWTYISHLEQYTREQVSPFQTAEGNFQLQRSSGNILEMAEQLISSVERITLNLKEAVVIGQQTVALENGPRLTYVVETTHKSGKDSGNVENLTVTYWIDKVTSLVLRQKVSINAPDPQSGEPINMLQEILLHDAKLNPELPDSLFAFNPPPTAERVDELPYEGKQKPLMSGREAPGFTLENLNGQTVSLSQLRGKVVLLDFWATWCGPCLEAHPDLQRLYEEWKGEGLVVMGINSESRGKIRSYMEENDYTFSNLFDHDFSVSRKYSVDVIPAVFIIDREGQISAHLVGPKSEETLRRAIREAGL